MPKTNWDKSSMKYALCFFPFVGMVIGFFVYLLTVICVNLELNFLLFCAIMVALPIIISGGIHLDGFIDTSDAIFSRQAKEKKLEILKDSHIGAFALISCAIYIILQFGLWGQFYDNKKFVLIIMLGFILSRALSALSIVSFKTANNSGIAYLFSDSADKKAVKIVVSLYILILAIFMLYISIFIGMIALLASLVWFLIYKRICYNAFGGITGDLAGYFLQISELIILGAVVIGGALC
jgi:adenosylcobinamide-GDP ribazoletransferase